MTKIGFFFDAFCCVLICTSWSSTHSERVGQSPLYEVMFLGVNKMCGRKEMRFRPPPTRFLFRPRKLGSFVCSGSNALHCAWKFDTSHILLLFLKLLRKMPQKEIEGFAAFFRKNYIWPPNLVVCGWTFTTRPIYMSDQVSSTAQRVKPQKNS